jgi:hypothetical protein
MWVMEIIDGIACLVTSRGQIIENLTKNVFSLKLENRLLEFYNF